MYLRTCTAALVLIVASVAGPAFSQSNSPDGVAQSWNELQLILPLVRKKDAKGKTVDKLTATFAGTARIGRGDDLVDGRLAVVLDYRINKCFSLLSGVVYRLDEVVQHEKHYETRLDFGGTFTLTPGKFVIRDRNMYERRLRNGRSDLDFYRNRVVISHPVTRKGKVLFSPFISEEGYYDITNGRWATNELFAGVSRRLNPRTVLDVFYVRNDARPKNVNGLGLTLKINLR